jgi:hypothetical protein
MYIWRAFPPPPACYFLDMEDTTGRLPHPHRCMTTMQPDATRFPELTGSGLRCVRPGRTQTRLRNEPNLAFCFQQKRKAKAKFHPGGSTKGRPLPTHVSGCNRMQHDFPNCEDVAPAASDPAPPLRGWYHRATECNTISPIARMLHPPVTFYLLNIQLLGL